MGGGTNNYSFIEHIPRMLCSHCSVSIATLHCPTSSFNFIQLFFILVINIILCDQLSSVSPSSGGVVGVVDEMVATGPFLEIDLAKTRKVYKVDGLKPVTSHELAVLSTVYVFSFVESGPLTSTVYPVISFCCCFERGCQNNFAVVGSL